MLPLQFCSCSFKFLSRPDKKKQMGSLANIDIPSLIQYIGVLQVNCMDPRNYFGHDLVQEAVTRLDEVPNTAPTYGALVMSKLSYNYSYHIQRRSCGELKNLLLTTILTENKCTTFAINCTVGI